MKRDFDRLLTEQRHPRTRRIDAMSVSEILETIHREDARVAGAVAAERPRLARAVELVVERLRRGGRMFFVGAGTSGRLGVLEAAEMPPTFDTPPGLAQAVMAGGPEAVWASKEGAEDDAADGARQIRLRKIRPEDVVVGIAASGVTPFVHGALREARRRGAGTILVSCNRRGVPPRSADVVVAPRVGPEVIAGSTRLRAGTATKMVLNALTVASMIRLGKVYENLMVDLQTRSDKLHARARRIVRILTGVSDRRAARALRAAGGRCKTAIVMLRRGVSREEAERLLAAAGGMLRPVLEDGGAR
jgi:N-acetylmuramic acid 6-phosphate etherase